MTTFERALPADNHALRQDLYDGRLFHLDPPPVAEALLADARALLQAALGDVDPDVRLAPQRLGNDEFFRRMGGLRRALFTDERFHRHLRRLAEGLGFDLDAVAFDPLRLRIIAHRGDQNPAAAAVYYPHRDTWYAHSQSLIVGWLPLDDLDEDETFVFFPDYFRRPAPNDSEVFDYDQWVADGWSLKIGWQDPRAGLLARYPRLTGELGPTEALGFACKAGELLLFSGAHLHQTRVQARGRTRYSLDFRLVDRRDHAAGRGAPNVDNRSRGSALPDYVPGRPPPPGGPQRPVVG